MSYKLWDKKTAVNGVEASTFLQLNQSIANDDLILVIDDKTQQIIRIESTKILATNAGIDITNKTSLQIFEEYEKIMSEKELQEQTEIEKLKAENEALKSSQTSQDELIMSLILGGA